MNLGKPKHSIGGVSQKFKRISTLYKYFGQSWDGLDWSDSAMIDAFNSESYGTPTPAELLRRKNGFFIGKQWMGVTVAMWKEDISRGYLGKKELYDDPNFPKEWLDKVLL